MTEMEHALPLRMIQFPLCLAAEMRKAAFYPHALLMTAASATVNLGRQLPHSTPAIKHLMMIFGQFVIVLIRQFVAQFAMGSDVFMSPE
jgi:hypothetical protein